MPGTGGTKGIEPVATTKRRARIRTSPAATSRGLTKRASARSTVTPMPAKRSAESCGAIAAIVSWTWSCTARKSISGGAPRTPMRAARAWALAALAAASSALDGTQP